MKKRSTVALATKDTHTMVLSKTVLETIIQEEFPHVYEDLRRVAMQRHNNELNAIKMTDDIIAHHYHDKRGLERRQTQSEESMEDINNKIQFESVEELYKEVKDRFALEELLGEDGAAEADLEIESLISPGIELLLKQLKGRQAC